MKVNKGLINGKHLTFFEIFKKLRNKNLKLTPSEIIFRLFPPLDNKQKIILEK